MTLRLLVEGDPGYLVVYDPDEGKSSRCYVHRLTATINHGVEGIRGRDVHHRDGIPENNARENLTPEDPGRHRGWNLPNGGDPCPK